MFMQVSSLCLFEDTFSTQISTRKASISNHLVIPLWCSVVNDLEVFQLQSSHKVTVTYTSGDTLLSKLFTEACIFTVRCHRV